MVVVKQASDWPPISKSNRVPRRMSSGSPPSTNSSIAIAGTGSVIAGASRLSTAKGISVACDSTISRSRAVRSAALCTMRSTLGSRDARGPMSSRLAVAGYASASSRP